MTTTTIGVSEAKATLSSIMRRVSRGESFILTQRGKEVGQITPPVAVELERHRKAVEKLQAFSLRNRKNKRRTNSEAVVGMIREGRDDTAAARHLRRARRSGE